MRTGICALADIPGIGADIAGGGGLAGSQLIVEADVNMTQIGVLAT